MPNNTRARSNELNALAAEIAARENVNPFDFDRDNRPYIAEIMSRGNCHKETARAVWARWLRRNRHPDKAAQWGGTRAGSGRKKELPD